MLLCNPYVKNKLLQNLKYLAKQYAIFSALLEREYIFSWFAWDGDNMLAFAGLLDYGSIRQFAARHDKYRFDDEDRFSTTLSEQSYWCRKILQYFVQAMLLFEQGGVLTCNLQLCWVLGAAIKNHT